MTLHPTLPSSDPVYWSWTSDRYDQGSFALIVRAGTAPLAYNFMVQSFSSIAHFLPDFVKYNKTRGL